MQVTVNNDTSYFDVHETEAVYIIREVVILVRRETK